MSFGDLDGQLAPATQLEGGRDGVANASPPPGGGSIPWSRWAACGVRDSRYKVVRDYERYKINNSMERSYARFYCGRIDSVPGGESTFGYRHIKDRHQSEFATMSAAMGRGWQDLAGWMMDWVTYDPDQVWKRNANRWCYQRKFYFVSGDKVLLKKRTIMILGKTGVRIMTFFPNKYGGKGYCNGVGSLMMYKRA